MPRRESSPSPRNSLPPVLPWPPPPDSLTESDVQSGKLPGSEESSTQRLLAVFGTGLVLLALVLTMLWRIQEGFTLLAISGVGLGVLGYCNMSYWLSWDENGLVLSRPFRNRKSFTWNQVYRVSHSSLAPDTITGMRRRIEVHLPEAIKFHFDMKSENKSSVAFAIALGRRLEESESTEVAKPVNSQPQESTKSSYRAARVSFLITATVIFAITFFCAEAFVWHNNGILSIGAALVVTFAALGPQFLGSVAEMKVHRAWRDNSAFTDPDRPIELLMYDQYGDLAEPLARFYRHVWANDAKRNPPKLP